MPEITPARQKVQTVGKMLMDENFLHQLKLALPRSGVTAERMARIVLTEVRRAPKLAECSRESLLGAVMTCAQLGLEPGPMGLAYIIPYGKEATLVVGYKGMLNLIWRSEQIASVQAEVVYEHDDFTYANGIPPELRHVPCLGDRGEPQYVYAVIGTQSGGWIFRVMTADEINAHRDRFSKAGKSSPWYTDWAEMACKTVLKRTGKRAPVSTEAQRAIAMDDQAELGIRQEIEVNPPEPEPEPEPETEPEEKPAEDWQEPEGWERPPEDAA